ncbi:FAD-dependent oxidoreductase [Fulvivirgaceae bacterium BMA12]|uniref:FAD-dependent oxidoreductase n=1 Tax=Agaribacillus aureus TaxID=3051825 RepID=A0ABT8L3Y9_9BACT|nr:FAD-dependent oxidoreductase [Fulvivirgaceae bacterium BMA12]
MSENPNNKVCVIIGASHAGVNLAFALRSEGWAGDIVLIDADAALPYHRPPLSKAYLASDDGIEQNLLKSADSYEKEGITLRLGVLVKSIDRADKCVHLNDDSVQVYDKLVLATGASPIVPPIPGIDGASNLYPLRTAEDVTNIRKALNTSQSKRVIVIGGGYIGLETAASLKKLGATVTVLEREERVLSRVTAPEISQFFTNLHKQYGVEIFTDKNVVSIETKNGLNVIKCSDNSRFNADIIVVGVGIRVNTALAVAAGLEVENGIKVNATARTSDEDIYAIGDCTFHHNPHYNRFIRLESVQNAVDQAKVAAAAIAGKETTYNTIPWFWSDQYDVKLQMVGLSEGYNRILVRKEASEDTKFSVWYFKDDELLAVDAVNNAKAYVIGTKFIKEGKKVDASKLVDPSTPFKPANLLAE